MGKPVLLPSILLLALACGGGSGSAPAGQATSLDYADPPDATKWRLVKDGTSTATHLVLDLLAPPGASGLGVTLVLTADPGRVAWGAADPGGYAAPLLQRFSARGADFRVILCQEGTAPPLAYGAAPVLKVSLDLAPGALPGPVSLSVSQGGHLGAAGALPATVPILAGTLRAR